MSAPAPKEPALIVPTNILRIAKAVAGQVAALDRARHHVGPDEQVPERREIADVLAESADKLSTGAFGGLTEPYYHVDKMMSGEVTGRIKSNHKDEISLFAAHLGDRFRRLARFAIALLLLSPLVCARADDGRAAKNSRIAADVFPRIADLNAHLSQEKATELPMKMRSLVSGEFQFYRGSADLFYDWCAKNASDWANDKDAFLRLHGDIHIGNIGTLRVTGPGGTAIGFGLVDFDETVEGPFQLDLLRGAVSLRFAARDQDSPLADESWHRVVAAMCDAYGEAISGDVSVTRLEAEYKPIRKLMDDASSGKPWKHAKKYLVKKRDDRFARIRFKKKKPSDIMSPVDANARSEVVAALWDARNLRGTRLVDSIGLSDRDRLEAAVRDVARWTRLGSGGSQGLDKFLVLLDRKVIGENGPFIIELKEEPASAAERAGYLAASKSGKTRARDVVEGHERLWMQSPWCVGYSAIGDKGFLVRSKGPWAEELDEDDFEGMAGTMRAAKIIGSAVGLAHRAGLRSATGNNQAVVQTIQSQLAKSAGEIEQRGKQLDDHLRAQFTSLKNDPRAAKLVQQADAFIASALRNGSSNR